VAQLEASSLQKTALLSDLQHELTSTRARLELLEAERRALENETLSLADKSQIRIKSLEKQVEALGAELEAQKLAYDARIDSAAQQSTQAVEAMRLGFALERQALVDGYEERIATAQACYDEKVLELEVGLTRGHTAEVSKLTRERNELRESLDKVTSEAKAATGRLEEALSKAEVELERLRRLAEETRAVNVQMAGEKAGLEAVLGRVKGLSGDQTGRIEVLERELQEVRLQHEVGMRDGQNEVKCRLDLLGKELNGRWEERLRREVEVARREVEGRVEAEKRAEVAALDELREREARAAGEAWQAKVNELLAEASGLRRELAERERDVRERYEAVKGGLEAEKRALVEEVERLGREGAQRAERERLEAERRLAEVQEACAMQSQVGALFTGLFKFWKEENSILFYKEFFYRSSFIKKSSFIKNCLPRTI